MHELSVCQSMLAQVQNIAAEQQAHAVNSITLRIGPLSGVESQLLRQAFPMASAGTIAAKADLIVETQPVRVHCLQCGADSEAEVNRLLCGSCGDYRTQLLSGDELVLASIELEK